MTTIEHFYDILKENEDIVIFKIGSDWCNACNKLKQIVVNSGFDVLEINVDDSFQLFSFLVLKKIIKKYQHLIVIIMKIQVIYLT